MRKALARPAPASDARSAAGLPAKAISGRAHAVMNGTRSTPEGSARHASSGGLRRNAFHASAGRHIRIGTRNKAACLALAAIEQESSGTLAYETGRTN
jgi:hypothetical protein